VKINHEAHEGHEEFASEFGPAVTQL